MKNKIPNLIMITCDEAVWVTYFTTRLWTKYLKEVKIFVLGYNNLVDNYESNVTFVSLGKKRELKTWFKDISNYLKTIKDDIILFSLDDNCLANYVNYKLLDFSLEYIKKNKVASIYGAQKDLKQKRIKLVDKNHKFEIYECPYWANLYACRIWKTKCLIKLYETDLDDYPTLPWMITGGVNLSEEEFAKVDCSSFPWQSKFEYYGKQIINQDEEKKYKFISIKKYNKYDILTCLNGAGLLSRSSWGNNIYLGCLKKEDIKIFYNEENSKYVKLPIIFGKIKNGDFIKFNNFEEILNNKNFYSEIYSQSTHGFFGKDIKV